MANQYLILLLITSFSLFSKSCRRSDCQNTQSVKLGEIDYSDKFKSFNLETDQDTLVFVSDAKEIVFIKKTLSDQSPSRYNDYVVCQQNTLTGEYNVYAYYEYENKNSSFVSDSALISINPSIHKVNDQQGESLYLDVSTPNTLGLKARVPISNIDTTITYPIFGELFTYYESIEIDGIPLDNIWVYEKETGAMYYSKSQGLVAFHDGEQLFFKN